MMLDETRDPAPLPVSLPKSRCHGARTFTIVNFLSESAWLLRRPAQLSQIWFSGRVDPGLREKVMLAVARANGCRFCTYAHAEWALAVGVSDAELAALEGQDERNFARDTWIVIAHARERASAEFSPTGGHGYTQAMVDAHGPQLLDDIECVARLMTHANRTMNTFDALMCRLRGTPVQGSRLLDEIVLSVVGVPAMGMVTVTLAARRGTGPRTMWRNFQRITRSLDAS